MLDISIVSFYNNFGLISKGWEDTATRCIEYRKPSTTPLSMDTFSCQNSSEYPHKPYISGN